MKPFILLKTLFFILFLCFTLISFTQEKQKVKYVKIKIAKPTLDTALIEKVLGIRGKSNNGEYKITIPQNDLDVEVDGFRIIPPMGLSTWIGFTPTANGAMIMGDLVLTETDLKPVQQEVINQGLTLTAIHNHFIRNHPNVMYMHVAGSGNTEQLAQKVKVVLDKIIQSRSHNPSGATVPDVNYSIDTKKLDDILGYKGEMSKGVYKYTIGRPDVNLKEHGVIVTSFLGFNTWAAFQGTMDHAAVAGDFAMLENEVADVIKALIENGIEVVAVHNHMVHEHPKICFVQYWGVGNAEQLAKGLKAALAQTRKKNVEKMKM